MRKFSLWIGSARLPFLVLTPACIVLGIACVQWTHGYVNRFEAVLMATGMLML